MANVTDRQIAKIPGWFGALDIAIFRLLLTATSRHLGQGDLAELGAYLGKSAVLLGSYLTSDEKLTVIDLFGADAASETNRAENEEQYGGLTQAAFEHNYRSVHHVLPVVIAGPTSDILKHAPECRHRLVHVDASHVYDQVADDLVSARALLLDDGIVAIDDYRSEHTPGVSAAAWQAMSGGLRPFALSPAKMYATWGDPDPWYEVIRHHFSAMTGVGLESQTIAGCNVLRLWPHRLVRYLPPSVVPALGLMRAKR